MTPEETVIDMQRDERARKATDDHSHNIGDVAGGSVTNNYHIGQWTVLGSLAIVLIALALLGYGLMEVSRGNDAAMRDMAVETAKAAGVAAQAERQAQNAEREARVAVDKADELRVQVEALKVIQAYGRR